MLVRSALGGVDVGEFGSEATVFVCGSIALCGSMSLLLSNFRNFASRRVRASSNVFEDNTIVWASWGRCVGADLTSAGLGC